jgi:hypothetical protein
MPSVASMCSSGKRITGDSNSTLVSVYSATENMFVDNRYFTEGQLLDAIAFEATKCEEIANLCFFAEVDT